MYIAVISFVTGGYSFKSGDEVPKDLPHNPDRLKRGLIKEVKVVKPQEIKAIKDEFKPQSDNKRKPKNKTKRNKQPNK